MMYWLLVDNHVIKSIPFSHELTLAQRSREAYQFAKQHGISERGIKIRKPEECRI